MRPTIPGEALAGIWPMAAGALILANDFVLRRWHPGFLSGKLSDVGICFLFPIVLVSLWEWASYASLSLAKKPWRPASQRLHLAACVVASVYYAMLELVPNFGLVHKSILSTLVPFHRFRAGTADPTDLAALIMVPLALVYMRKCERSGSQRAEREAEPKGESPVP